MGIKIYNKTTAGRRFASVNDYAELTDKKRKPCKALLKPKPKTGGRNHSGKITSWWRGGGNKQLYRLVDFSRKHDGVEATVEAIEYDPNRSCHIALITYTDGTKSYILAPVGLKAGAKVMSGPNSEPNIGNCLPLEKIPVGLEIHNVELTPGQGGRLGRSAGAAARLVGRDVVYCTVQLPSGELRQINGKCRATIGQIGNIDHQNVRLGKAGRTRHLGRRPHNRGTSMNPVAHPLGGGEGRSGGGRHPCSAWGKLSKGGKTRNPRKNSSKRILRRRMTVRYGEAKLRRR